MHPRVCVSAISTFRLPLAETPLAETPSAAT
jgi:hypothetical protein